MQVKWASHLLNYLISNQFVFVTISVCRNFNEAMEPSLLQDRFSSGQTMTKRLVLGAALNCLPPMLDTQVNS
jgi:hypothetical protein